MKTSRSFWHRHLYPSETVVAAFGVGSGYAGFVLFLAIITLPIVAGIFILGRYFYLKYAFKYAFTNKRIISLEGWFVTHLVTIDYDHITDISVKQDLVDKYITRTGTIVINTAGTNTHELTLHEVDNPHAKVSQLHHLIEESGKDN